MVASGSLSWSNLSRGAKITLVTVFISTVVLLSTYSSSSFSLSNQNVLPVTIPAQVSLTPAVSPVVFVMVMFGADSAREGVIAMKTALMHLSRPAEFHIMCGPQAMPIIQSRLELISRPMYDIKVHLYHIEMDSIDARCRRGGIAAWTWGGFLKLWMHEILLDVDRAIYFDTDMMFLVDPYILWKEFDYMTDDQIISLPTLGKVTQANNICSCVMLMKFPEMRERVFMASTLFSDEMNARAMGQNDTWAEAGIKPWDPECGDQGLYWAIWKKYPQNFMHLSETWDVSRCRQFWHIGLDKGNDTMTELEYQHALREDIGGWWDEIPERYPQIFPGIVHYNCLPGDAPWDNPIVKTMEEWGPYVDIARQYKWVWLNRGDGSATVTVTVKENVTFYDEQFGQLNTLEF